MNLKRLAIISSHPIQYNAPLFRLLTQRARIKVKVFYTLEKKAVQFDRDFGKSIEWDLPLMEGYEWQYVSNGGSDKKDFWGVKNPTLEKEIQYWTPDAIMVYGWNYYSHLRAMHYFRKQATVIFRGDSTLIDEEPGLKSFLRRKFLSWVYNGIDKALYTGENNRAYFVATGLKSNQLKFGPHAVDNERFAEAAANFKDEADELKKSMGISAHEKVIVFAGKFQPKKNPLLLLKAFNELNPKQAHLVFVGNGELESDIKNSAEKNSCIHILPFQNQLRMPLIYQLCDIFCLPSAGPGETWGLAVNEAMACRKAVLVSDKVGCAVDLVDDGQNGFIFRSGDMIDLKKKLSNLLFMNDTNVMGSKSYEKIQEYSYTKLAESIETLL
ncbi:glycosyltransferase family 4 protein [Pollutibacter soli]|uniref:glycosyltransferase family 4 protein n=1 Tax=Pollutibacter soli TaxID=3034157 RepID=UPI003013CC09